MASYFPEGWQHYLAGGLLIGTGVSFLFLLSGRIGGMSSVFTTTWSWFSRHPYFQSERFTSSRRWRLVYALGLVLGALAWWWIASPGESLATSVPTWQLLVGGFWWGSEPGWGAAAPRVTGSAAWPHSSSRRWRRSSPSWPRPWWWPT
jgi:uncharacterized protein